MSRLYYRSRFGLHFQRIPSWAPALVGATGIEWIKIVNPPPENPFPGKSIIGRICLDSEQEGRDNALIAQGATGAETYFEQCVSTYDSLSYVDVWEGPNEPPVETREQRTQLSEFELRWIELMHARGKSVAGLSLSVGQPEIGTGHEFADVARVADFVALHAYGAPTMRTSEEWYALRYRKFVAELAAVGVATKIMLTEAGIDRGVLEDKGDASKGDGWKSFMTESQYLMELIRFDQKVFGDLRLVCFTPFTSGWEKPWESFDVGESLVKRIGSYVASVTPPPVPPPEPPPPAPPVPVPSVITEQDIRLACWQKRGVPYNPTAALQRCARDNYLGAPLDPEFDWEGYRIQAYIAGIVWCKIGEWHDVKYASWHNVTLA